MISSELQNRRRVRPAVTSRIAALLLLVSWMCIGGTALVGHVCAQQPSVTAGVTYSHSPGTGHADGVGITLEGVVRVPKEFESIRLVGGAQFELAAKRYLGNGTATRGWGQVRWLVLPQRMISPLLLGGVAAVNNHTTGVGGYSKTAWFGVAGTGVNFNDQYVATWEHYFREYQTQNQVASDRFGLDIYLPLAERSKWLVRMKVFTQRTNYTQPNGPARGEHTGWAVGAMMGMGWKLQ